MPENLPGDGKGLLASLTALAATLVAIAHTRLDLLSSDLEEEREHLLSLLVLSLSALFFSASACCWRRCWWWSLSGIPTVSRCSLC